jgi:hypothetical protein
MLKSRGRGTRPAGGAEGSVWVGFCGVRLVAVLLCSAPCQLPAGGAVGRLANLIDEGLVTRLHGAAECSCMQ